MALSDIRKFAKETKQEALKVSWPSRKETVTTSIVVFIMMFIMAIILFLADASIASVIKFILGLGD